MATLHAHAHGWTPPPGFTRIRWDREGFLGNTMVYGSLAAKDVWELFPPDLRSRLQGVAKHLGPLIDADPDVGLIHADLHLGNAVYSGTNVALIDFDDSGTGPRIYELAVALSPVRDSRRPFWSIT